MLTWIGKRPLSHVTAFPAQHIETFNPTGDTTRLDNDLWADWPDRYPRGGLLFHGDNKEVLAHLLANGFRGKVKLIYIDPPFDSGADYVRKVRLRGAAGMTQINGEGYSLGEQIQYEDIWAKDNYLQFIYERLIMLKEFLTEDGSIFVHINDARVHYVKIILDEIFGESNFRNQILLRSINKNLQVQFDRIKSMNRFGDFLLWYSSSPQATYKPPVREQFRKGYWHDFKQPADRRSLRYPLLGVEISTGQWMWEKERAYAAVENYQRFKREFSHQMSFEEYAEEHPNEEYIRLSKTGEPEYYLRPKYTTIPDTLWDDILAYDYSGERGPTQKSENLLERVISFASNPGDIVLDAFVGWGTTAAVAQKLGRRWIGCDINKGAIQTTSKRLQTIIQRQIAAQGKNRQGKLIEDDGDEPAPAQLSFTVWRVNDYDLQIQHNEAVNLVCEHIGIQRTRTDPFFDGTLGRNLVKIIPFNHPLSLLDLDEIRRELEARPEEDRNITVVCLGMELAAQGWLKDWNRLRTGKNAINRIEVIELRTDPRYGKFIAHNPASAKVKISRQDNQIQVEIEDFISPTIIERLQQQAGILKPQIEDWRAMVDCVMIDTAFDGEIFNVVLSDVPERKNDLVVGSYTLPAPDAPTVVAVKIIDMLGEEVLITERV